MKLSKRAMRQRYKALRAEGYPASTAMATIREETRGYASRDVALVETILIRLTRPRVGGGEEATVVAQSYAVRRPLDKQDKSLGVVADRYNLMVKVRVRPDDLSPEDGGYGRLLCERSKRDQASACREGADFVFPHMLRVPGEEGVWYLPAYSIMGRWGDANAAGTASGPAYESAVQGAQAEMRMAMDYRPLFVTVDCYLTDPTGAHWEELCGDSMGGFEDTLGIEQFLREAVPRLVAEARALVPEGKRVLRTRWALAQKRGYAAERRGSP